MSKGLTNLAYLAIAFAARLATEFTANASFFAGRGLCFILRAVPQFRRSHFPGYFRCLADPLSRASSLRCDPGQCRSSLQLRHEHGSQYLSADFQNEVGFLGVRSSPVFVRAPEGNGCLLRAIRDLKEQLLWLTTFETAQELRFVLRARAESYNKRWLIERRGFKAPGQRCREHYAQNQQLAAREKPLPATAYPETVARYTRQRPLARKFEDTHF
jgi:hypothetical protein